MIPEPESHVTDLWHLYETYDEEAPEFEVVELITGFVRALKPNLIVETGTANGFTSTYIAGSLRNNKRGKLVTYEIDPEKVHLLYGTVDDNVEVIQLAALKADPWRDGPIDMLFIDACLEERAQEYLHFEEALRSGGIALLHDTLKFDPPKQRVLDLAARDSVAALITLPTPRGLTIIQKA